MPVTNALLGNAAVAAVLALVALTLGRTCRSVALRHAAWVLVLLKLVTPPLFPVPLHVLPASWDIDDKLTGQQGDNVTALVHARPEAQPTTLTTYSPDHAVSLSPPYLVTLGKAALTLWAAGAVVWFVWQGRRIVRFRRRLARAEDAGLEVAAAVSRLAAALGIVRPPQVKAALGIGSPMLWGWGRGAVILFPRDLLARLAPEARDTLLAHELAHFLRRDHWVRVLEFVATGLYWWHPAVWVARLELEAAEEECCDAWVVGGLGASPRRYAEALLTTVDFAAELRRPCLPPGACAANRGARLLHRRLVGVLHAGPPRRLRGAVALRATAVAALLLQPVLRAAPPTVPEPTPQPASAHAALPAVPPPPPAPRPTEPSAWATAPSPDGTVTAVARDYEVVLRRPDGSTMALGPGKPLALAFAPRGQRLATAGPGPLVRTWDYEGRCLAEAQLGAPARALAYTPDGSRLLVLDGAGGISVRDPQSLIALGNWTVEGPANSIACAPDGQTVAVACGSWLEAQRGWVELWSIAQERKVARFRAPGAVGATRFGPDGKLLVAGGWDGTLTC